jgi:UDP-glucose 4-epimerase
MTERVLVTGGAGFIGSHLVDTLVKNGFQVIVFDDLSTGRMENVKRHVGKPAFSFVNGDLRNKTAVKEALKDVEAVFHLAAIVSVPFSMKHPQVTHEINVDGTASLLEACLKANVERFIYASSCAVYGEPKYLPIDENHPAKPLSPYAESKLEAENLCMSFHENYGLGTVVLRLFNVYGPRMREDQYGGVITRFIKRLTAGKPPIIYGDGEQTRDFVYVGDVVQAMMLALKVAEAKGETFNIGSGVPVTINDLADLLIKITGACEVKPVHRRPRAGDIKHSYANVQLAKKLLGFKPNTSLKDGLSKLPLRDSSIIS